MHNDIMSGCCEGAKCSAKPDLREPQQYVREQFESAMADDDLWNPGEPIMKQPEFESSVLREADKVAGTDRSRYYGHPLTNHRRIADIWSVLLGPILKRPITPQEVVTCMIGLKLARLVNTPGHHDSLVDICGYAKCHEMIDDVITKAGNGLQGF